MSSRKLSQVEQESQWTASEALEWAWDYYSRKSRWPIRRFRVEGSSAGNSKLLTERQADKTRAKYGGHVNQLIPELKYAHPVRDYSKASQ